MLECTTPECENVANYEFDGCYYCHDCARLLGFEIDPPNWCCVWCHTSNGCDDIHCVNCGRKDMERP